MDTTTVVRLVAGILFVIGLVYLIQRRRRRAVR
jgi:LPXTG-motif cell wall-anchored protein